MSDRPTPRLNSSHENTFLHVLSMNSFNKVSNKTKNYNQLIHELLESVFNAGTCTFLLVTLRPAQDW